MPERAISARLAHRLSPLARLLLLFALSYGMLYYSYKHDDPRLVGDYDFLTRYYAMYLSPLDLTAASPPAIYRQLSAVATHLVYAAGIYYPNAIAFADPRYDQHVFFAALLTNYVCLVLAAWLAGMIVQHELKSPAFVPATVGGIICLLSFSTQVSVITGLTEGLSWLMFALGFLFFLRRWMAPLALLLVLAIFERELILILFAAISGLAFLLRREERRRDAMVFIWSLACFAGYFVMRKIVASPFPERPAQLDPGRWLEALRQFHITKAFVFEGLLSQNLLAIYVVSGAVAIWLRRERLFWLPVIGGAFLVLAAVAVITNNDIQLGRLASILSPVLAALTAISWERVARVAQVA